MNTEKGGLTSRQAAAKIGVSDSWMRKSRISGDGPRWFRAGNRVIYREEDIDDWIESRLRRSTSETLTEAA